MFDFKSFFLGHIFCMFCDVVFSVCNYFVQKSLDLRHSRKKGG